MNAYSGGIKNEITLSGCNACSLAMLSGLLHSGFSIVIGHDGAKLEITTQNVRLVDVLRRLLDGFACDITEKKRGRGVVISVSGGVDGILTDTGIINNGVLTDGVPSALLQARCCRKSYVRGAFLGAGAAFEGTGYLEFALNSPTLAEDIVTILNGFDIAAKVVVRGEKYVINIKDGESVSDCLALLGAKKAVFSFNNRLAEKSAAQRTNRALNCISANIDKAVEASIKQRAAIERLKREGKFNSLNEKLKEAAQARLDNAEATLAQLAQMLGVSKGCLKYRLDKLMGL